MKIVACPADLGGCGFYRVALPALALAKYYGHTVTFADRPGQTTMHAIGSPSAIKVMKPVSIFAKADVIWLQRVSNPQILPFIRTAQANGQFVVMDQDDDFDSIPEANPNSIEYGTSKAATETLREACRLVDGLIVSTPDLSAKYKKLNSRISICYNAIADEQFHRIAPQQITGELKRLNEVRIGYAGSDTHRGDFASILNALQKVMRKDPRVRLVFIGADLRLMLDADLIGQSEYAGSTSTPANFKAADLAKGHEQLASVKYYDLIVSADLDLQIAPLASTTFNRAKSWLKLQQAGMAGVPIVCSRFGPYKQYAEEAPPGVPVVATCGDSDEWKRTLRHFIESPVLRASMAQANMSYVKDNHLMSARVGQWQQALEAFMAVPVQG